MVIKVHGQSYRVELDELDGDSGSLENLAEKKIPQNKQPAKPCGVIYSPHGAVTCRSFRTSLWYVCRWETEWGRGQWGSFLFL